HFAVDPQDPHNRIVVDLEKAPVNRSGRVEFSSDLYILSPKAPRGNGAALVEVLNRGRKLMLEGFNRSVSPDPEAESELGDGFLMRFGYTLVWVGWEFDLDGQPPAMRIQVPIAARRSPESYGRRSRPTRARPSSRSPTCRRTTPAIRTASRAS